MAQSRAGEGIDKWLASLDPNGRVPKTSQYNKYNEWSPQKQRDLDFKNAVNDFVDMLARHGEVKARPDLEHSVEELAANAVGTGKIKAPAVRGPMQRYIPGVAGTGQPGEGKGPEGGLGDTIKKLIAHLEDRLSGSDYKPGPRSYTSVDGQGSRLHIRDTDNPTKLEVSDAHRAADTRTLKRLGKPGKALNRGLM